MYKKAWVYEDLLFLEPWAEYNPLPKQVASTKKAQQLLQQRLSYTLHKPRRQHFPTLPTLVFGVDEQWQIDLPDLKSLAKWNKGY